MQQKAKSINCIS